MDLFNIINNNVSEKPVLVRSLTMILCKKCQTNLRDGYNIINHSKKECKNNIIKYKNFIEINKNS
jgi:hypothetical protein